MPKLNAPTIVIYFLMASSLLTGILTLNSKINGYQIIPLVKSMITGVPMEITFSDGPEIFTCISLYLEKESYSEGEQMTLELRNDGKYFAIFDSSFTIYWVQGDQRHRFWRVTQSDTQVLEGATLYRCGGRSIKNITLDGLPPGEYLIYKSIGNSLKPEIDVMRHGYRVGFTITGIPQIASLV